MIYYRAERKSKNIVKKVKRLIKMTAIIDKIHRKHFSH